MSKEMQNWEKRRSLVEWYDEERKARRRSALGNWLVAIVIFALVAGSYFTNLYEIGNGAHNYSEQAYTDIVAAVSNSLIIVESEDGERTIFDLEKLQEQIKAKEGKCMTDYDGTNTVVTGVIQRGYFEAIVTITLSETKDIINTIRNYNSIDEYMREFWLVFGARVAAMVVGTWTAMNIVFYGLLKVVVVVVKKIPVCIQCIRSIGERIPKKKSKETNLQVEEI